MDPAREVENLPQGKPLPNFLFEDEAAQFIEGIDGTTFMDIRDRALLEVMYSTGGRVSELCGIKCSSINFKDASIRVKGKGSKERVVFLCDSANEAVLQYLPYRRALLERNGRAEHDMLFINAQGRPLSTRGAEKIVERRRLKARMKNV